MKSIQIQTLTVSSSAIVYVISLTQYVVTVEHDVIESISSWQYLTLGSVAIFGGGVLEWLIWLANPLYIISMILFIKHYKISMITAFLASFLAVIFSAWEEIRVDEKGISAKIIHFDLGYYLWVSSILILTTGTFIYFRHRNKRRSHHSESHHHRIITQAH
ncbi:hypothetical protein [Flavobacterium sp.]|uniref:hypothetical protein n=1 Tax=Flavobacterium sp. TaxID=239 RepID=UPI00326598FC